MKKLFALFLCLCLCVSLCGSACAQTVTFGRYQNMPINWTVLKSNDQYTKLISAECINCMPYGNSSSWESSSLRAWLNNV